MGVYKGCLLYTSYYRPTFVLTRGEEGVKGSARSIEGYHIYEEMTKCSSFFTKYGGHKMAAGLSMREEDVEPFRQKINEICTLTEDDLQEKIHIDVPMPVSYVSFRLVEELELLEPFGTCLLYTSQYAFYSPSGRKGKS